jgi:predicted transcriptional regulator of viral defense system
MKLTPLTGRRAGYVTTAQAAEVGVSRQQLSYLARTGSLERVAQGIYRLQRSPAQRFEDVIVACLWAGDDAVASHDTALAVYELTDAMPAAIHVSVPHAFRGRRPGVTVHAAPLGHGARTERAGVPVTTVERTIADVLVRSGAELASRAAEQALDRGLVSRRRSAPPRGHGRRRPRHGAARPQHVTDGPRRYGSPAAVMRLALLELSTDDSFLTWRLALRGDQRAAST